MASSAHVGQTVDGVPGGGDSLHGYDRSQFVQDLGAGLTVGIMALPLAMALAIASGVKPEQVLFTAIIAGFLISALGGSQVQIGGPAGAFIVIVYGIVERYGLAKLLPYRTTLPGTLVLTVVFDLTVAVEAGLMLACGFFIWRMSQLFSIQPHPQSAADGELPPGVVVFELFGSLFFGAVGKVEALPAQLPAGTRCLVLEMHRLISVDTSGIDALQQLHRSLQRQDIALLLANVNAQPLGLICRSGFEAEPGVEQIVPTLADLAGDGRTQAARAPTVTPV